MAVGRRGGCPGADRGTAPLAGGAPRPRVLHPGRLPDADPGRAPPVARSRSCRTTPATCSRADSCSPGPTPTWRRWTGRLPWSRSWSCSSSPRRSRGWSSVACCPARGGGWRCCRSTCSARWRCGPPSGGRWPSSTSRSASSCSSRPGLCCIGCRRTAAGPAPWSCSRPPRGSCSRNARCCTPWCSASWPWRSPRQSACAGSSWRFRSHLVVWVPLVALIVGYVVAHRALRPDRQRLAGLGGGVGRAGRQLPGPQRRPGLRRGALGRPGREHHRHPDDLGGGSRLDRPRGGRGPHVVPFPLGCLGLAAAVGLHPGGRRPALRRSDRSGLR